MSKQTPLLIRTMDLTCSTPQYRKKPCSKMLKFKFNYEYHANILKFHKILLKELKSALLHCKVRCISTRKIDVVAAVWTHLEVLAVQQQLDQMGAQVLKDYKTIFEPCPHTDKLPTDIYCHIKLKDASKTITTWSYSSP